MKKQIKQIKMTMYAYPTSMQDVPAGREELQNIRRFIDEVENIALKYLPVGRHVIKVREEYYSHKSNLD